MAFIADFGRWLAELDPVFGFLCALPFAVAAAGLMAVRLGTRPTQRSRRAMAPRRASGRPAHVR
jgi:hypothetical protein